MDNIKLNAEFVTELEFVPGTKYGVYNRSVSTPHTADFEATGTVRVGKATEKITLSVGQVYMDGGYKKYIGLNPRHVKPFATLTEAGLEIDYDSVMRQYFSMLKAERYTDKLRERAKEINEIRIAKKEYDESWIHTIPGEIKANRNKRVQAAVLQATFKGIKRDVYVKHRGTLGIYVIYKGFEVFLKKENGTYSWDGEEVYELPADFDSKTMSKYNFKRKVDGGKTRRAKLEGTIFLKFAEAVDYYIARRDQQKTFENKAEAAREEVRAYLEDKAGRKVTLTSKEKYEHRERRYGGGYYKTVHTYTVEGITIDTKFGKDYLGDGKYTKDKRTFSVKTLNNLDETQFKGILDLLIK